MCPSIYKLLNIPLVENFFAGTVPYLFVSLLMSPAFPEIKKSFKKLKRIFSLHIGSSFPIKGKWGPSVPAFVHMSCWISLSASSSSEQSSSSVSEEIDLLMFSGDKSLTEHFTTVTSRSGGYKSWVRTGRKPDMSRPWHCVTTIAWCCIISLALNRLKKQYLNNELRISL